MLTSKKDIDVWCKNMHISNYVINDDLSIKAFQDIDIFTRRLNSIPVKFSETTGGFNCSGNNLTSLENVPNIVGGIFNCSHNNLTSLEHSPKIAKSDFNCENNKITSLKGITPIIGGDLKISSNPIEKLDYCPSIGYNLLCHDCHLTSFEGFPQKIVGTLGCTNNKISSFDNCPTHIGGHFYFDSNPTFSFENAPKKIGGNFTSGFDKPVKKDLNKPIVELDLLNINIKVGGQFVHYTDKKENFLLGFENLYIWKNNFAILILEKEQFNILMLNNKLNVDLHEKKQTIKKPVKI